MNFPAQAQIFLDDLEPVSTSQPHLLHRDDVRPKGRKETCTTTLNTLEKGWCVCE